MPAHVTVFIDYQNMYRRARDAFWPPMDMAGHFGNFQPLALARLLAAGEERALKAVRVYTGVPAQERDTRGYEIMQRRTSAWQNANPEIVSVHTRAMRYPPREGREKGVDVELAIDFVALAMDGEYNVAVVASADTDLIPALELVAHRFSEISIETAAWKPIPEGEAPEPLDIPGGGIKRRTVDHVEFARIADRTNYTLPPKGPAPGQSGRQLPKDRR